MVIFQKKVAGLTESTVKGFVSRARRAAGLRGAINVLVTGSAAVRSLNRRFRGKDKTTDVLSFPSFSTVAKNGKSFAGDIAICADVAVENAARFGHPAAQEVKILILHGILHLAGLDHERDNGQMARTEARLRHALNLPSALIERTQSANKSSRKKRNKPRPSRSRRRTA